MLPRFHRLLTVFVFALICLSLRPQPARAQYNLIELGPLNTSQPNYYVFGTALNDAGQVVGYGYTGSGAFGVSQEHAFRTAPFSRINLLTDDLGTPAGYTSTRAYAINALGDVVGQAYDQNQLSPSTAFLYKNGQFNLFAQSLHYPTAYGINSAGTIVGTSNDGAFIYLNGVLNLNNGTAYGVNAANQFVGQYGTQGYVAAFPPGQVFPAYTFTGVVPFGMQSVAQAVNASGQVVGWSEINSTTHHAILFDKGVLRDLGTLPGDTDSEARAINDAGQIVGVSFQRNGSVSSYYKGFFYANGRMFDLNKLIPANSLFGTITEANGINRWGAITGTVAVQNRYLRAYLLWQTARLVSITLDNYVLPEHGTAIGTVTLTRPAGPDGLTVSLSTDAAAHSLTLPASVQVPPGALTATFPIATGTEALGSYSIKAAAGPDSRFVPFAITNTSQKPVADASVSAGAQSGVNWGANQRLFVSKFTNDANSGSNRAAYLKFDFTALTTAPPKARLYLAIASNSGAPGQTMTVRAYDVLDSSWQEATLNFNNAPALNRATFTGVGTPLVSQPIRLYPGALSIDVTAFVAAHVGQVATLQLINETADGLSLVLNSKEAANGQPTIAFLPPYAH